MLFTKQAVIAFFQASTALAATVNVKVGGNNALVFNPTTVQAAAGDTVRFQFLDLNHTATAGKPGAGCQPSGNFNSGFIPIAAGTNPGSTFDVKVTDANPITVYCAQAQHCQQGMVMVINPTPSGPTSLKAYKAACAKAATNVAPARVNGGTLRNVQNAAQAAKGKGKGAKAANGQAAAARGQGKGAGQNAQAQGAAQNGNQAAKGKGKGANIQNAQAKGKGKGANQNAQANNTGNGPATGQAKAKKAKKADANQARRTRSVRRSI